MLSKEPIDLDKVPEENIDKEILRWGIMAELDAINLYEQFASKTKDPMIKKVMLAVAKEEKEHVGEFQTLLLEKDKEQVEEMEEGKKEVEEMKTE
ncbi:MAG: rubrerythrin [Candidatus Pacearchaeota archaeon]|nr:rubrerythrin [Candidatus Pacearchaeota archaeon]